MKPKSGAGFTLIELLVVIAIIGVLASIVLVSLNTARAKARDAQRLANKKQVITAMNLYYQANGAWPPNEPHGNGAGNGFSCFAPGPEHCWSGFYDGSDALVAAMAPYLAIFPKNNAVTGTNAYDRLLYTVFLPAGGITTGSLAGAYLIWMQERTMAPSECNSALAPQYDSKYYYCWEFVGPP